jgi:hypothetical protein
MGDRFRIEFESISAIRYPQMYDQRTDRAIEISGLSHADALAAIPEDWWTPTAAEHDTEERAREQYDGLHKLIAEGEWIRNVRMLRSAAPEWEPTT